MIESFAIHTAVLVGLIVTWLWTERLGGIFAGFAVPGYVGAIALVAPASAATLVIEAILTYAVVWVLGEGLARWGAWARVFGRERFLLFVVVSVPVRLLVEGLAAGGLQRLLGPFFPDGAGDGFFSVGLVLVPLLANTFWKPGLARGLLQVGITTALTVVVLLGLVMPVLGLSFSSFFLSFEDIALAFVAVPKVYVILICTAVVATWTAERFGFNAGGLLVPALLGLLILEPTKLLTTVVEIVALTAIYRVVTSLPGIRGLELAGSRRLVAMYVMAWGLKLTFAWLGQQLEIPVATWNLYGFGYLLSSLVAVRCLDLRPIGRVLLPMSFNIGAGAGLGLLASLVLATLLPERDADAEQAPGTTPMPLSASVVLAAGEVREDAAVHPSTVAVLRGLPWQIQDPQGRRPSTVRAIVTRRQDGVDCMRMDGVAADARGARTWWCGGEGPIGVVLSARTEPDTVWLAARLLDAGTLSGLVLLDVDASYDPPRADRVLRALSTRVSERRIVVVQTGPQTRLIPVGAGAPGITLRLPQAEGPVPVALGAQGPVDLSWFAELDVDDAVLELAVSQIEADMDAAPPWQGDWSAASSRDVPDVDPRAAFVGHLASERAAASSPDDPLPPGVAWAARAAGLRAGSDERGWVIEEAPDRRRFGRLLLRPGAGTDHVLVAPRAPDELGTAQIALRMGEDLDARAVWIARRRARGLEPRIAHHLDGEDASVTFLREVLRGERGSVGRIINIRQLGISSPEPPVALLAEPRESLNPFPDTLLPLADALDHHYAGWQRARGRELEPAAVAGKQPLRYAEALGEGRAATVWIREDLLAEVLGTPDREALERWYGLQGVSLIALDDVLDLGLDLRRPVPDDNGVLPSIVEHFEAPTLASVGTLQGLGRVSLLVGELRVAVVVSDPDRVCIARAGAQPDASEGTGVTGPGCWARKVQVAP